jgi:hypothetical protein
MRTWTDADVERFPMLAQTIGQLFLAERNGYLPKLSLTKEEKQRSEKLAQILEAQFEQYHEDPRILQAALQRILEHHKFKNILHNS